MLGEPGLPRGVWGVGAMAQLSVSADEQGLRHLERHHVGGQGSGALGPGRIRSIFMGKGDSSMQFHFAIVLLYLRPPPKKLLLCFSRISGSCP